MWLIPSRGRELTAGGAVGGRHPVSRPRIADGGAERLFADIHPEASFAHDVLTIDKPFDATVVLDGRGLLLVPSAFVWPRLSAITKGPWQPTLMYPARGIATLWDPGRPSAPEALAR